MARKSRAPLPDVFRYEARHEGRTVVVLHGVETPDGGLAVETEAYPVGQKPDAEPLKRTFAFPTADKARRFTEDALMALEYQNCVVNQHA